MNYDQFINMVKERARLDTDEKAVRAVEATLSTLGQRMMDTETDDLAAQLPQEAGRFLTGQESKKNFGLDQFYEHVSRRESVGVDIAEQHAKAVMSVVMETVTPGELDDVLAQLPEEYLPLFTFSSTDWRKL